METAGGGWTLVWSYTFTDYNQFKAVTNAITPRPNWQATFQHLSHVPVSTTPPLDEQDYNAFDFLLWKQFGRQILVKSNINNWLVCSPGEGSLVDWQTGTINCKITRRISQIACLDSSPPTRFVTGSKCGPMLKQKNAYYYFVSCVEVNWPTHDPCGQNKVNGLKSVKNPHGNILIR